MLSFASPLLLRRHRHALSRPLLTPHRPRPRLSQPSSAASAHASTPTPSAPPLIIGLNEYSHDTSLAILHASTGSLLLALSKERLTRRKHDGGDVSELMERAITALAADLSLPVSSVARSIALVVANNHHFRIAPFEKRLPFQAALRYVPSSSLSAWNLVGTAAGRSIAPEAMKVEMSHHLAHAYSAVYTAPFESGLVVVMDGMGDARDDWLRAEGEGDPAYYGELRVCGEADGFREFPTDVAERKGVRFREAETAYRFRKDGGVVTMERVFKRWTPENEPPELPNHSFEEMDSVGAVYSRVAAIIFRDWNACGKVMGLAPYAEERLTGKRKPGDRFFMKGDLYDGSLCMKEGKLKGLEHIEKGWADTEVSELREYFEDLAYHVQKDLEDVVMTFMSALRKGTGEQNIVFAGGVALNSTLNGMLAASQEFKNFYVPPYPGDEGVAIGCAAFGYFSRIVAERELQPLKSLTQFSPYLGIKYSEEDIKEAIHCFNPWITWREADSAKEAARALSESRVVAWFRGRSEFGPRALGSRSVLADPRPQSMVDHVNKVVKRRETFRPFAPSVLGEHAHEWFEECLSDSSPFMSMTKQCTNCAGVRSVVHVDGTSRLQTVTKDANPEYHEMISHFRDLTGIPMVLNTSFNVAGEPIVESPYDALRTFLGTDGIDMLVFPGLVVEKCMFKLSETDLVSSACSSFLSHQTQDGGGQSLQTKITYIPRSFYSTDEATITETTVELIDALQLEILEHVHDRGTCSIVEVMQDMLTFHGEADEDEAPSEPSDIPTDKDVFSRLADLGKKRLILKT